MKIMHILRNNNIGIHCIINKRKIIFHFIIDPKETIINKMNKLHKKTMHPNSLKEVLDLTIQYKILSEII